MQNEPNDVLEEESAAPGTDCRILSIRMSPDDQRVLAELKALTGARAGADLIRRALRRLLVDERARLEPRP